MLLFVCFWCDSPPCGPRPPHSRGFLDHIQRRTTVGRTPLDEWSARRRNLYLTTHNTHNRQTSMPPVGFEPTISAGERPQTYALDRVATEIGIYEYYAFANVKYKGIWKKNREQQGISKRYDNPYLIWTCVPVCKTKISTDRLINFGFHKQT